MKTNLVKIDEVMFWRALKGKTIVFERMGSEYLGCNKGAVIELTPSNTMVNLSDKWFALGSVRVKEIF